MKPIESGGSNIVASRSAETYSADSAGEGFVVVVSMSVTRVTPIDEHSF